MAPEQRIPWWPGLAAIAVLASALLLGRTAWNVDQWREWVLFSEPGFTSPGMDVGARLPAGIWVFEWIMRPWAVGPTPWRALPVMSAIALIFVTSGRIGRGASMAVAAGVLLPPFVLYTHSAWASAVALALTAWAWVAAMASQGRNGWGIAAAAVAIYPAAAPALAATGLWRLFHLRREGSGQRIGTLVAMAAAAGAVVAAYRVAGTDTAGYLDRLRLAELPAALLHVSGGPVGALFLAALLLALVARSATRAGGLALVFAWLVAGIGVAARTGPWSLLQPAFVLSGPSVVLVYLMARWRLTAWVLAIAIALTVALLTSPPPRQWRAGSLVEQWSDANLPRAVHEAVLRWDTFLLAADDARAGAEPMGEFGLPVRWALEFENQSPWMRERIRLETDISGPWCENGPVCSVSASPATSLVEGPVLVQFLLPRRLPTPLVPAFVACGSAEGRVEPQWQEVRVVDLYNMLGIVGRIDLPAGCHRPDFHFLQGEWQVLQADAAGTWRRLRGTGQHPHTVQRF